MKYSSWQSILQKSWLELLLILSIIVLALQITGPQFIRWWQLPQPGNVGIEYLSGEFFQNNTSRCLAFGYVGYLPGNYLQSQNWPLVVYLHGSGGRGNDPHTLVKMGRFLASPGSMPMPAVMLLPQCRKRVSWQPRDIAAFVECACHKYRIDRKRIYLVGYSMGGYGTWATAAEYPNLFAAIVPIAGGGNINKAVALSDIPIWAFHGANDTSVPAKQTTKLVDAIRAEGGNPKLTIFLGIGHGIPRKVCKMAELWQWLFRQNLQQSKVQS